jgi:predicted transcriptional regulator
MKYRSRTDIVAQILEIANDNSNCNGESSRVNKTKIMYGAYLSYAQLKEYLGVMLESGLLEQDPANNQFYRTTQKGWQFLKLYNSIGQLANSSSADESNVSVSSNSNSRRNSNNNHANASSSAAAAVAIAGVLPKDTTTATVKIIHYKKK